MALFELNSEISIGTFRFRGVHEVRISRSMTNYMDTATVTVPSWAKIVRRNGVAAEVVATAGLLEVDDRVVIKLGYNGVLMTEFEGFVKRKVLNMPLTIECEGYGRRLRLGQTYSKHYKNTTARELLEMATKGTGITLRIVDDLPLVNVTLVKATAADIVNKVKELSKGVLNIFFVEPTVLWCGLLYTPYSRGDDPLGMGRVKYRLGYNVVKENGLQERVVDGEPVQILMGGVLATGQKVMTQSEAKDAPRKVKRILNNVGDVEWLKKIANEKQYTMNYAGYEGTIRPFLRPYCGPGWVAEITDRQYPERNGTYAIEAVDVQFGLNGARRVVSIGPKLGFKAK